MALIDDVFSKIPETLLNRWGLDMTYVKAAVSEVYDPATGTISGTETSVSLKGVILKLNPKELNGDYQTNDIKVIIGNEELGDYYPNVRDRLQYTESELTREGRIVDVESYRGENAIMHSIILRPQ
tara:strand:- start:11840 stop:12217 length:378 start_codon:yes stop_codon:yes gene_type:complete